MAEAANRNQSKVVKWWGARFADRETDGLEILAGAGVEVAA